MAVGGGENYLQKITEFMQNEWPESCFAPNGYVDNCHFYFLTYFPNEIK